MIAGPDCHDGAMAYDLEDADVDFLDSAPIRITHTETVRAPVAAVWRAMSDPAAWVDWFGNVKACAWTSEDTRRVGSTRRITVGPAWLDERFLVWEEDAMRYFFTVSRTRLPMARRMVEGAELHDRGDGRVDVTWHSAVEPRGPFPPKGMIRMAFGKGLPRGFAGLQAHLDRQA